MNRNKYFISCDWGTTNFRLRIINRSTLDVTYSLVLPSGVKSIFEAFSQIQGTSQFDYFQNYLREIISQLPSGFGSMDIVLGGMASSSIGMKELPYAKGPFRISGETLYWEELPFDEQRTMLLVSGVQYDDDVMRGEELIAIGLEEYLINQEEALLILPGTHSKHLYYRQGCFEALRTYMTGELFSLLIEHSILKNSVQSDSWKESYHHAFLAGLRKGQAGLTRHLFKIRVDQLLKRSDPTENYFTLSGMLIGDELKDLFHQPAHLILAAPDSIRNHYAMAMNTMYPEHKITTVTESDYHLALIKGQNRVLQLSRQ